MSITGSIVLLATLWFIVFFCVLPVRFRSQAEAGSIVPGTPASAPSDPQLKKKFWITWAITLPIWVAIVVVVLYGGLSVYDLDVFGVLGDQKGIEAFSR
jgi:predicted secreted protein